MQVLIVMDFLLSLSVKAKEKLSKAKLPDNINKSVLYADQALSEDDVSNLLLSGPLPDPQHNHCVF